MDPIGFGTTYATCTCGTQVYKVTALDRKCSAIACYSTDATKATWTTCTQYAYPNVNRLGVICGGKTQSATITKATPFVYTISPQTEVVINWKRDTVCPIGINNIITPLAKNCVKFLQCTPSQDESIVSCVQYVGTE